MDYSLMAWLGMKELMGSTYTKNRFTYARAQKETPGSLDGLEGKVEEWTGISLS